MENNEEIRKISHNLKEAIIYSGKTKSEIALALKVSNPTLSQYLSGQILPSLPTFQRLCKVLDVSADDILSISKH